MIVMRVPIFSIHKIIVAVKIKLIHPEENGEVLRLPLLLVSVAVFHAAGFHNIAAPRIVSVMCCGDIRKPVFFHLLDNSLRRLGCNAFMPKFFAYGVSEIVMLFRGYVYIADWTVVLFKTNRIRVSLWLQIF